MAEQIGQLLRLDADCTKSLFVDFTFNSACIKILVSKLLGYLIIVGSLIIKVPQILKILASQQVKGLNIYMFLLELVGFTINLFYSYRMGAPFSTYGENVFMLIQNMIILILFFQFEVGFGSFFFIVTTAYSAFFYAILHENIIDQNIMLYLSVASIPIFTASKIPQIITNWQNKSTGQLSAITVFMQFAGTAARVFTTIQEVDDLIVLTGFLSGFALNVIIMLQVLIYWNNSVPSNTSPQSTVADSKKTKKKKAAKID